MIITPSMEKAFQKGARDKMTGYKNPYCPTTQTNEYKCYDIGFYRSLSLSLCA